MEENNVQQNNNDTNENNAVNSDKKLNKKEKRYAIIIKVFLVLCVVFLIFLAIQKVTKKEEMDYVATQTVNVTHLKYGDITREISVTGTVQPIDNFTVNAKCSGEVKRIYVRNGDTVHTGDKICEIDNSTAIENALITYDQAKSTFERYEKLYNSGNLSKQDYENYKTSYDKAKLDYETQIDYATPTANGDGVVDGMSISLNNLVSNGQVLCYINSEGFNEIRFGVSERVLHGINIGDKVIVTKQGLTYDAEVVSTSKQVNTSTGQFDVKAMITTENKLASGVLAKCTFTYEKAENAAYISRDIVYYEGEKPYVYTVTSENTIEKKFLETGIENEDYIVVLGGVDDDTKIISTWSNDLSEGALVNINEEDPIEHKKETTAKIVNDEETKDVEVDDERFYDSEGQLEDWEKQIAERSEDEMNEDLIKYQMMEPVIASISNTNLEEDKKKFDKEVATAKKQDSESAEETTKESSENSTEEETTKKYVPKFSSTSEKDETKEMLKETETTSESKKLSSLDETTDSVEEETTKISSKLAMMLEEKKASYSKSLNDTENVKVEETTAILKEETIETTKMVEAETTSLTSETTELPAITRYRTKFNLYRNNNSNDTDEIVQSNTEE